MSRPAAITGNINRSIATDITSDDSMTISDKGKRSVLKNKLMAVVRKNS